MKILGISAFYHDSAAALVVDGRIVAAAEEERFTRKKHDASFPTEALTFCLKQGRLTLSEIDAVVFYEKPLVKFERLLETYLALAPRGFRSFVTAMPIWLQEKLFLKSNLKREFRQLGGTPREILFSQHHLSHAASAFYPSPYSEAAVLCLDGVGEWSTSSAWLGNAEKLNPLWEMRFPHSLGLLYSAFTYFTGFKVNSGEYKLMGLAPYGEPKYVKQIYDHLLDLKADGSFRLNLEYFDYCAGLRMTNARFASLFGGPARRPESEITARERDLAASIQIVTEEIILRLAQTLRRDTGARALCLAGGVALNCVANGRLLREGPFDKIWIQPAAGDSGGAIGAALAAYHGHFGQPRIAPSGESRADGMQGAYLGPEYAADEIRDFLDSSGVKYHALNDEELFARVADLLQRQMVVGWFQGRMEFGPRALGNRSILADPRSPRMQSVLNQKIKFRESFRPFAPSVLAERAAEYFDLSTESPYMLLVAPLRAERRKEAPKQWGSLELERSEISAVTHVDYSARVQTVTAESNPRYYRLLEAFASATRCPVLINTSFNVRGEPLVCTPANAYRCFLRSEMDVLVLGNYILYKNEQPVPVPDASWKEEYALD